MNLRAAALGTLALALAPSQARAADWAVSANAYHRLRVERSLYDPERRRFEEDANLFVFLADATLRASLTDAWRASLTLDTGELSERTFEDGDLTNDSERDFFLREGYVAYEAAPLRAVLGKQPVVVGRSYILDDFLVAADVEARLPRVLGAVPTLGAGAAIVRELDRYAGDVPLLATVRAALDFPLFDRLAVFGAWLADRGGLVAEGVERELFGRNKRLLAASLDSRGDLFWFGAEGELLLGPVTLSGIAIGQKGRVRLEGGGATLLGGPFTVNSRIETEGFLFDAEAAYGAAEGLFLRAWCLMASGSDASLVQVSRGRTFRGFLAAAPFITRTNLFFNGGINAALSTRSFATPGVEGRGFLVPGATLTWEPLETVALEATAAYLRTAADPGPAGREYGWEADFEAAWTPLSWLALSAEFDVLFPGNFYDRPGLPSPRAPWRFLLGADLHL